MILASPLSNITPLHPPLGNVSNTPAIYPDHVNNSLALKDEGNRLFKNGEYVAAIAKYEHAIGMLDTYGAESPAAAGQLHLVLLTSRLNAYNKSDSDNNLAHVDLLEFLRNHGSDDWTRLFGHRKLCKAYFHLSQYYESQDKPGEASDMIQTCFYLSPDDKDVLAAHERLERVAMKELVRLGVYKDGTASSLSTEGQICVHCLEDLDAADLCIKYHCKHGFHEECARNWLLHEGEDEHEKMDNLRSLGVPKKTCPSCRAAVIG